jgi:plasmid stability protein
MMFFMRTTLTLEDDLSREIKERARSSGRSFKEVVNETLRRGLSIGEGPAGDEEPFRVEARACGFRAGIDPLKLNQLYDDMELEDAEGRAELSVHEP